MEKDQKEGSSLKSLAEYLESFAKWLVLSVMVGVLCGLTGVLFYKTVSLATAFRTQHPWTLYLLPVGGLIIVWLYQTLGLKKDPGTDGVIASVHGDFKLPFRMAPLIFLATAITHFCGGSAGREGAALQIGGSVGVSLGRALRLPEEDHVALTMCGMSALFSALFGTPITAMVFSMEVISIGIFHYGALVPCMVSSLMASLVTSLFHIRPESFVLSVLPAVDLVTCLRVLVLAALGAAVSILFCIAMHKTRKIMVKHIPNAYLRILAGAAALIVLTLLVGSRSYNGAGMDVVERAMEGEAEPLAFLLKILFTAITLAAGFKGGEIVPSFFVGACFGCVAGKLLGLPAGFGAAIGLISVFCGATNCPLASILLSIELFGADRLLLFGLACAVSYSLSGYYGLYGQQKILYSKLRTKYINRFTQ